MRDRGQLTRTDALTATVAAVALIAGAFHSNDAGAQTPAQQTPAQPGSAQVAAPRTPRTLAPIDLTGTYVSIVTEDWLYRMPTPAKGDYYRLPLNADARRIADAWDPAKDEAAGEACKSYGAAAIMRVPGRVRFSWQDDFTLKIETDAGQQTRLLHFGDHARPPATGDAGYQGFSTAAWEYAGGFNPNSANSGGAGSPVPAGGALKVQTTKMKAGYLRKNGVPYSENAVMTEYYDRHTEGNGDEWFTVTTIVTDPTYLTEDFFTTSHFKREAAAGQTDPKWRPTPCAAR